MDADARSARAARAGLILAAGRGSRFDGIKQLASFRGRPLIEHSLGLMAASGIEDVYVVLGYRAELVERSADLASARVVRCPGWAKGMSESLREGLRAVVADRGGSVAVAITLADQPLITPQAIDRVAFAELGSAETAQATYAGRRGHPVLLGPAAIREAMELKGDSGARSVLERFEPVLVPCDGLGSDADADTPERLRMLETVAS